MNPLWLQTLAIGAGGAFGAMLRFGVNHWVRRWWHDPFPLATLMVNAGGSFLMGLLTAWLLDNATVPGWLRAALGAGFLGALTTFSAFSLETLLLLEQGAVGRALVNVAGNVALCLLAVWLGFSLLR